MPEATAIKQLPPKAEQAGLNENWITYNDQGHIDFQKSVKSNLAEAGIHHDPVPPRENELPVHVPTDGKTVDINTSAAVALPETFKPNKLDHIRHIIDFTGDGAPPRVGKSDEIKTAIQERTDAVMKARNSPQTEKGILVKVKDWFYDNPQPDRFPKQNEDKKAA